MDLSFLSYTQYQKTSVSGSVAREGGKLFAIILFDFAAAAAVAVVVAVVVVMTGVLLAAGKKEIHYYQEHRAFDRSIY